MALWRPGERWLEEVAPTWRSDLRYDDEVDVCHLFHGHELSVGGTFAIKASDEHAQQRALSARIVEADSVELKERDAERQSSLFDATSDAVPPGQRLSLDLSWSGAPPVQLRMPISSRGGISIERLERQVRRRDDETTPVRFVTTDSMNRDDVVSLFESIVLTPEEDIVLEALQTIEPQIQRIAPVGANRRRYSGDRGGLAVKLDGIARRVPIGSMGDGLWRMLGIALSLTQVRGGVLLVDEIDTGLHFSVMADMWNLVRSTAERLDVQVFATTHSRDCFESLSVISRADETTRSEVSIQRIERGRSEAVAFSEAEIVIAAERGIEVR